MADTRNPSGRPDNLSQELSASRKNVADQRPAGPSDAAASPGMAEDTAPLPPGVKPADPNASSTHPGVAGNLRHDFDHPPDSDPSTNERDLPRADGTRTSARVDAPTGVPVEQPIVTSSPSSHQPDYVPPAGSEPQGRITTIAAVVALVVIIFLVLFILL